MKITLFSRPQHRHNPEGLRELMQAIQKRGLDYVVNEEFAPILDQATGLSTPPEKCYKAEPPHPEEEGMMLCLGGDGTLLEGARRLAGAALPVAGIQSGRLGFLTGVQSNEVEELLDQLLSHRLCVEQRTMLQIEGSFYEEPESLMALNEIAIQRSGAGMISVESFVDGQMVATYHGDGVLLSTPTGSTAYSLSAGGPVVAPSCACLVLSPLAPHNLTMRPVVIPDQSEVRFKLHTRGQRALLSIDNRTYPIGDEAEFTIRRSDRHVFLVVAHNTTFYDTLRKKMMWGVDVRG
uniref:NAD(+)/NADH kinase n=1 Tax=Alistipes sp. TaxID=1872444 RepID=UPI0040567B31